VQADSFKIHSRSAYVSALKLEYQNMRSNLAFNFNLRHYNVATPRPAGFPPPADRASTSSSAPLAVRSMNGNVVT
jgi:hypothetical protein